MTATESNLQSTQTGVNASADLPPARTGRAVLDAERAHLGASRSALAAMRQRAAHLFATGEKVAGDAHGAESLGRTLSRRVAELADDPNTPLFFGRLDFGPAPPDPEHAGHHYHIGRRHVTDERGEPMVVDWRAPVSRAFYRASVADPLGVATRRRFGFQGGTLTGFEDERLEAGEELGTNSRILTEEIERPRVGPMRDIVATIQPEQDELVRADLDETICVQGAPGTGKTAVGLHRAAFLLYQHRERLRRSGVLIVGPNRAFLHYIAAVLPALGEVDVTQSTLDDLVGTLPVRGTDRPDVAALKHDVRMAAVLEKAIRAYVCKPAEPLVAPDGSFRWRLSEEILRRVVDGVRREGVPHAVGRDRVRARVLALLQRQVEVVRGDSPGDAWLRRIGRSAPVVSFMDACWPAVSAESLLFSLYTDSSIRAAAARGLLGERERELLAWDRPPRTVKSTRWSAADLVLLDEAAGLIERPAGFAHVVVDEAQDLSAMHCRVIARRSSHGSITLLGDLAQGTAPWAARDWESTLEHLGKPGAPVIALTTGFRVPEVVLRLANRLLDALPEQVPAAVSLRHDGSLAVHNVSDVDAAAVAAVRAALEHDGSIGVIAADPAAARLATVLRGAGLHAGSAEDGERVSVLPATLAKGLEFDHVIVVEPAEIVAAEERGLNRLYVVLTRAVSRLDVLHALPLPAALLR